ncbi:HNH endonuclease [Haliscomenobacter sp.]|uniref:HNH endonuclease n=1 Tax=Haliscomenobacter sp. TaxID=2717303 RepID=UPI0035944A65
MAKLSISQSTREAVAQRANYCCEYCKSQDKYAPNSFTIDHILPESLSGSSDIGNLAYACFLCNRLKSNKVKVLDRSSHLWTPVFNPRINHWEEHFSWNEDATLIIGLTSIGRCTVNELQLNRQKLVEYRRNLIVFGVHPPT